MKKLISLLLLLSSLIARLAAAQVGIGGQPDPSAALDVKSSSKAFYPPRLSSTQRQAVASPQPGALVYDTDKAALYLYDGQSWLPLSVGDPGATTFIPRTATDGATYDRFGSTVAIAGDYAVVGAPDKTVGTYAKRGGAYVYQRLNGAWTQQALLEPGSSAANQHFGSSVAIAGDYILVGQQTDGAAYRYHRNGSAWQFDGSFGIGSGPTVVALSASYAAIVDGGYTSKVYIYQRTSSGWSTQTSLTASDAKYGSGFSTIAMNDNDIICGDPYKAAVYPNSYISQEGGEAHVFHRTGNTWAQQAILRNQGAVGTSLGPKDRDRFGASVAIEGDLAVVGANWRSQSSTEGDGQGAVYFFRRTGSTWKQEALLFSNEYPEPAEYGYFGSSVAISNGYVLVGVPSRKVGTNSSQGAAYLYKANSAGVWLRQAYLTDTSAPAESFLGASMGLSGNYYLIGAPGYQLSKGKVLFGSIN